MKMEVFTAYLAVLMSVAAGASANEEAGHRPPPPRPPEVAYQACDGLDEGEKVQFSTSSGEYHGVCTAWEGRLVAMPEYGMRRHDGRMPAQRGELPAQPRS